MSIINHDEAFRDRAAMLAMRAMIVVSGSFSIEPGRCAIWIDHRSERISFSGVKPSISDLAVVEFERAVSLVRRNSIVAATTGLR